MKGILIATETAMRDENGQPIRDCLQPKIRRFGDTWYAYGFNAKDWSGTIYSTQDFLHWTRCAGPVQRMIDVLHNRKNNAFVGITYKQYGGALMVYTSASPTGPFVPHNEIHDDNGHGFGDIAVFQDTDGKAYLIYNKYVGAISQRFAYVYQLGDSYYNVIESSLCNTERVMEGFWMFKRGDVYYLLGSGLVAYDVDDNFYLTAPTPLGPWTYRGLFAPVGGRTFNSQTFQGLEIAGRKGTAHVFIGHRWNCTQPNLPNGGFSHATSIWLPLVFCADESLREMEWRNEWILDLDGGASLSIHKSGSAATPSKSDESIDYT